MAVIKKYITETIQEQETTNGHINYLVIYNQMSQSFVADTSYTATASLLNSIYQNIEARVITERHPEVSAIKPILLDNNYKTDLSANRANTYLQQINTLKTNFGNFEFNLGVITSDKVLEVVITSSYNEDLKIENVTSDDNIGIYTNFLNGLTIPAKSSLTFVFNIRIDKGKDYINNKVYFHLSNGLIIDWKFCFIRALTNLYFLPPDKNTYKESYYFVSKTFVSLEGKKDVIPFMDTPKKSFSATYSYRPYNQLEAMRNIALMNEYKEAYFPIWSELTKVTKVQTTPSYIIYVERISDFIKVNSKVALINLASPMEFSILSINSIAQDKNAIIVSNSVKYDLNYIVVPIVEVVLNQNPSTQYYNVKEQKLSISVRTLK